MTAAVHRTNESGVAVLVGGRMADKSVIRGLYV